MSFDACLSSSRFLAFFDECGDHSLVKINPQLPLFLLCTVIVDRQAYAEKVIPAIGAFKLRYFAHEGVNLHSRDIRKAEGPFAILQNAAVRERFMTELTALIAAMPATVFATAINKHGFVARYGHEARNPYNVALEYSFERVLHFMEAQGETHLPVIAEARGKQEDNALQASFYKLLSQGTHYNEAERFRKLVCPISFRRKNDNIAGIQLADLCAHPIARRVLRPGEANRAFDVVAPHIYQAGRVNGLKVFPK